MEIKYLNFLNKKMIWNAEAIVLLTSYLFTDDLTLGGEPSLALQLDKKRRKLTPLQKVNFVYSYTKEGLSPDLQEDLGEIIEDYYEWVKSGANNIAKDRRYFIELKKIESDILNLFEDLYGDYEGMLGKSHYPSLRKMMETYPIRTELETFSRIGISNKKINPTKEAEKILDFIFSKKTTGQPTILLLEIQIFITFLREMGVIIKDRRANGYPEFVVPDTIDSYCQLYDETPDLEELLLPQMLSVPAINHLNYLELIQLKKELKVPIDEFNAAANSWIECRNKSITEKETLATTHVALFNAGMKLEEAILQHPLSHTLDKGNASILVRSELYFFQIKMEKIWGYFEKFNLVHQETIAALRSITANNPAYPLSINVIGIALKDAPTTKSLRDNFQKNVEAERAGRKKSIDLD